MCGLDIWAQSGASLFNRGVARYPEGGYAMNKTAAPIPFASSQLDETRHVCAFFNGDDEEYRVLLPFIKDGFECGHKAIHVVNPHQRGDHLQRLAAVGIDAADVEQSGQLEIRIKHGRLPSGWPLRSGSHDLRV